MKLFWIFELPARGSTRLLEVGKWSFEQRTTVKMNVFEDVGVEGIVTLLLSFMFILSLKNVLRRPPKNQKQQSLRSLLSEIEEEEKDDEEIKEKIENKAKGK